MRECHLILPSPFPLPVSPISRSCGFAGHKITDRGDHSICCVNGFNRHKIEIVKTKSVVVGMLYAMSAIANVFVVCAHDPQQAAKIICIDDDMLFSIRFFLPRCTRIFAARQAIQFIQP